MAMPSASSSQVRSPSSAAQAGRLMALFERVLPAIDDEHAARYYMHVRDMAVMAAEIEVQRGM